MPRPKAKPAEQTTSSASKRSFLVLVGIDYGKGYKPEGLIVDDVPADIVATWIDEGVITPVDLAGSLASDDEDED